MHRTTERIFLDSVRRFDSDVSDVEYYGRAKPYQVSHYLVKKRDGTVVNTPYLDLNRDSIGDVPSTSELHTDWQQFHRPKLIQWLQ